MKTFKLYLKEKKSVLVLILFLLLIMLLVSYLYSVPVAAVSYTLELWILLLVCYMGYDYYTFSCKYKKLKRHLDLEVFSDLEMETAELPLERAYQELIARLLQEQSKALALQVKTMGELKDYYATWAHQIKTPISAMKLMLQVQQENEEPVNPKDMQQELYKIENYTDAVMNYLRLEDMSSDYYFKNYRIRDMVNNAVRKSASQFLYKKIAIQIDCGEEIICTDKKWYEFILGQILSNAVKYSPKESVIRIYMQPGEDNTLVIADAGIGIGAEDLPRIMERGYTGYNGRMDKKSSGIGLYLSKKAADKLGIGIHFWSEPGVGTKVYLRAPQEKIRE